jgi:hypothetical protein
MTRLYSERLYMFRYRLAVWSFLAMAASNPTLAQSSTDFVELAESCMQVISEPEGRFAARASVQPFANALEELAQDANQNGTLIQLAPVLNQAAADCVAFARQISAGAVFDAEQDRYVSAGQLERQLERQLEQEADRESLRLREEEEQKRRRLEEEQRLLTLEVDRRVHRACLNLAADDPNAAYTNLLCVESFKANGLPD